MIFKILLTLFSLFLSGWADSQAFVFGHRAFVQNKVEIRYILISILSFLGAAIFYLLALWFKRDIITLPTLVEFLLWLLVAYIGILIATPQTLRWPLIDHFAVLLTLICVSFLAYRHGE